MKARTTTPFLLDRTGNWEQQRLQSSVESHHKKSTGTLLFQRFLSSRSLVLAKPIIRSLEPRINSLLFESQPIQNQDINLDGRGLQFDYNDRIVGRRLFNFSLTNRVMKKATGTFGKRYDQAFLFRLSQAYDLIESQQNYGLPWQDVSLTYGYQLGISTKLYRNLFFPYHKTFNINSRLRTNLWTNSYAELIYTNYLNVPRLPVDIDRDTRQESLLFSGGLSFGAARLFGVVEYSFIESRFLRYMLTTEIVPPGDCWVITGQFWQTLATNDYGWTANIKFRFGR